MKIQQFNSIEKRTVFEIYGGKVLKPPITDPMEDPNEGKQTKEEENPATS